MTAEIAVMNKSAVALAADSKVTIGSASRQKTYDTVNKVFTLSKIFPVGIMIYGNAEFMGYAWELLIKQYRKIHGGEDKSTVREWSESFIDFIKKFGEIDDEEKSRNTIDVLCSTFDEAEEVALSRATREDIDPSSNDFMEVLCAVLTREIGALNNQDVIFDGDSIDHFRDNYLKCVTQAVRRSFPNAPEKVTDLALAMGIRSVFHNVFSPLRTGVVISGFGRDQFFPELISFETDGYVGNEIKIAETTSTNITKGMRSCVQAFAQSDMTNRFMDGIDSIYSNWLVGAFEDALTNSCLAVLDEYGKRGTKAQQVRDAVTRSAKEQVADLSERAGRYRQTRFSAPILDMVALLPKDELAQMAESLVALTSFKRRISTDAETVGGPVDVAIISKEDGFVWIKRKHYFTPELNPHFLSLYLRDIM